MISCSNCLKAKLNAAMPSPLSATSNRQTFQNSKCSLISISRKIRPQHRWQCPISPSASLSPKNTTCFCMASLARAKPTAPLPLASKRANASKKSPSTDSLTSSKLCVMPKPTKTPNSSNASPNSISSSSTNSATRHAIPIPSSYSSISSLTTATKRKASF